MTTNSVIRLVDHKADPSAEIVELLETLLERAQSGEIIGIAVAYSDIHHGTLTAYNYENWLHAVGAAALLHHDVLHSRDAVDDT